MSAVPVHRHTVRRIVAVFLGALGVVAAAQLTAPTPVHAAVTRIVQPSNAKDLTSVFERLRAGDTLLLAPGTYDIGTLRPALARGTADARITVKAQDPAHKPLLRGWLRLERPYYWTFSGLRVQATLSLHEAIDVFGGRLWSIQNSEIFGATQTGAFANIAVSTYDDLSDGNTCGATPVTGCENPSGWSIYTSCIHDAGRPSTGHPAGTLHNIYLNGTGDAPGRISRNIMYGAYYGSQVKIGNPSTYTGYSGVAVDHNTMHASAEGVLVTGKGITRTYVRYNLMKSTTPQAPTGVGAGVYLDTPGRTLQSGEVPDYVLHNYGAGVRTATLYRSYNALNYPGTYQQVDNQTQNTAAGDPRFTAGGCSGYRPANAVAARYGRYGTYFGTGF